MSWHEVSIEDFPPERDDEPSSLRQDILDELTDHFVCALNRELLKNPNEQLARQSVLNQFGDPVKIARQLWFDAMKERMMSQRMMTGFSAVMTVCCIAVVGIAWSLMKESQSVNQKMLEQLTVIAARPQEETKDIQNPDMNQVSFQLVQQTKEGKPAVGFTGKLTKSGKQTDTFTVDAVSSDSGNLDFGTLPWGKYQLKVKSPWGESYFDKNITVIPGRGFTETIVCPSAEQENVPVQFQIEWPDKLKSEDWVLLCDFRVLEREGLSGISDGLIRKYANNNWHSSKALNASAGQPLFFLIDNQNQVSICPHRGSIEKPGNYKVVDPSDLIGKPSINLIEGDGYVLPVINLFPKKDLVKLSALDLAQSYSVLNTLRSVIFPFTPANSFQVDLGDSLGGSLGSLRSNMRTTILLPFSYQASLDDLVDPLAQKPLPETASGIELSKLLRFSAVKDQENVWKIKLAELEKLKVRKGVVVQGNPGGGQGFF